MTIEAVDIGIVSGSDELVTFYSGVLAVPVLEPRQFPFATVHRLDLGPATLKIMVPTTTTPRPEDPPLSQFWDRAGFRYLTLWVDDLDLVARRWDTAGGTVAMPPTELRPGIVTALLVDPDGNTIEAMQGVVGPEPPYRG